jgi:hypothetical protein
MEVEDTGLNTHTHTHTHQADMHHTEVENTGLRKLVKLKEREHTKIKRLASVRRPTSRTHPQHILSHSHQTRLLSSLHTQAHTRARARV